MRAQRQPLSAPLARSRGIAVVAMTAAAGLAAAALGRQTGMTFGAALGAMVTTFLLWNPMVVDRDDVSLGGAAALGLLVVVACYPIMLTIGIPAEFLLGGAPVQPSGPNADPLADALYFIAFTMTYGTVLGLVLTGWITVPIGIAVAMAVAWWTRRAVRRAAAPPVVQR